MKTLGLLGGMSWESTLPYYRYVNEYVRARLGGLHSAKLVLYSVDFHGVAEQQRAGDWDAAGRDLARAAQALERAGAEAIVLCTNTMHKVAGAIEAAVAIPLLHIADTTGAAIVAAGVRRVALLGTRFTMEQPFYAEHLRERYALDVRVPEPGERDTIHRVIYDELCQGRIRDESRIAYQRIIERMVGAGAQGVILGCTEIGLLIGPRDVAVATFETTALHAQAAVDWALR